MAASPNALNVTQIKGTSVSLSWEAPACDGGVSITDYRISYSQDQGATWLSATKAA
ncbi:MAG: fibronectin type III domain-containing protein, partial [Rhodoluna sp.]